MGQELAEISSNVYCHLPRVLFRRQQRYIHGVFYCQVITGIYETTYKCRPNVQTQEQSTTSVLPLFLLMQVL